MEKFQLDPSLVKWYRKVQYKRRQGVWEGWRPERSFREKRKGEGREKTKEKKERRKREEEKEGEGMEEIKVPPCSNLE